MSNLQKWGSYDLKAAKQEQEELARSGSSAFFKPKNGPNKVRFLPPPMGKSSPFVMVHQHYVRMPGMANAASFNCPRVMEKRPCPVCAEAERLRGTGNPADYEQAGEFMAKLRVFGVIVDRAEPELGPQVFAYGKSIHETLVALREADDGGDFTHPIEGFDIVIEKTGQGKEVRYAVRAARNSTPLADPSGIDDIMDMMPDVGRYARVPSDEDLRRILNMAPSGGGSGRSRSPSTTVQGKVTGSRKPNVADGLGEPDDDV